MEFLKTDNLPTPKEEKWKYTNLGRAMPEGLAEQDVESYEISAGSEGPQALLITGKNGAHSKPQLHISVAKGRELTVIERHDGEGAYWKNMITEIKLEDGARLHHIRIQNDTPMAVQTNLVHITLGRDAEYKGFALNMGGKLTRHDIHAELTGENGTCSFNGINMLKDKQHGDTTILIEHQAPHCNSNQFYRTLLDDGANGVFQGKVHVHQVAQKTDGYQLSNALLLSDKAEMDTKPELEIYADDVKCSHGATTGQLDEEPLFYLRSRGLSAAQARFLMIQAFLAEVIEKIGDEALEDEVNEQVAQWLQNVL